MSYKNNPETRARTVRWSPEIDEIAERLAAEGGYFVHPKRGVSDLLADLVLKEAAGDGSPAIQKQFAEIRREMAKLKEKEAKLYRK